MDNSKYIPEHDVICAGAGFGAITTLHRLRKQGLDVKIFEKGPRSGGIWYWNCYPGARVDSDSPLYQLFDKEIWQGFTFQERYPSWQELRRYFDFLDEKLNFSAHTQYNCAVTGATFDESRHQWLLTCADGSQAYCRWFIAAIGFAAKIYIPPFKSMDKFKGEMYHTAEWPQEGVDLENKRIAVIGTGASGIQTIQECGPLAKRLTVYQRTPNYAIPMNQRPLDEKEQLELKKDGAYEKAFDAAFETFAGFEYDFSPKKTFDDSPEERAAFYKNLLIEQGGFKYWLGTYRDMLFDQKANDEAYTFWRDYVRSRVKDPRKAEYLAPTVPPHPWGTKRPSLEQSYYEVYNLPNVDLIDLEETPIEEFTATGIRTRKGLEEFDMIILATGFDAVTGSLAQLDIRGTDGKTIAEHWQNGLRTSVGISVHGFPNMFFLYGPQAPTAFSNGPSCTQIQARWIDTTIKDLTARHITRLEATEKAEDQWSKLVGETWDATLFPKAKSWYNGSNIPGKRIEPLNWAGGIPAYIKALDDSVGNGYQSWVLAKA